jgi:hypothetical protein
MIDHHNHEIAVERLKQGLVGLMPKNVGFSASLILSNLDGSGARPLRAAIPLLTENRKTLKGGFLAAPKTPPI